MERKQVGDSIITEPLPLYIQTCYNSITSQNASEAKLPRIFRYTQDARRLHPNSKGSGGFHKEKSSGSLDTRCCAGV